MQNIEDIIEENKDTIASATPWQVKGNVFAISPSAQSYTLNYSVDYNPITAAGNWEALSESTPANDPFVGYNLPIGCWIKLVGNTSNLVVRYN